MDRKQAKGKNLQFKFGEFLEQKKHEPESFSFLEGLIFGKAGA